jgi:hypothetical protein
MLHCARLAYEEIDVASPDPEDFAATIAREREPR